MLEFVASILELFSSIALNIQEFLFRRKREKRRDYEREHKLPRKKMISPYKRYYTLLLIFIGLMILTRVFRFSLFPQTNKTKVTEEKIVKIRELLEKEKDIFGKYPEALATIKRNNPLRNDLIIDGWGTTFTYKSIDNSYILTSAGSDRKINTKDDLIFN